MTPEKEADLRQAADETARGIVAAYAHDPDALVRAIAQLALTGLRIAASSYLKD